MSFELKKLGKSKVYRLQAKKNIVYPAIRLPAELTEYIGKDAEIYLLANEKGLGLLLVFDDSLEVLKPLLNQPLESRLTELEHRLNALFGLILGKGEITGDTNKTKADPAGFEPATLGLGGPRPIHARLRVRTVGRNYTRDLSQTDRFPKTFQSLKAL